MHFSIFKPSLRTSIFMAMLAILVVSFLITGGLAYVDHFEQNANYNELRFQRKEKSVRASMDYFLQQSGGYISPDSASTIFNEKICELSDVHSLFIALYDTRGNYLISTNSQTFDSLGLPYKVNYSILKQLSSGTDRAVFDKEFLSEDFTIAYWYFTDQSGKPIAIVNVTYDRADADTKDIWAFIRELGASYFVLFLLTVVAAYLLSAYISRPIRTVTDRLREVKLGGRNEPIEWNGRNEVGVLVEEYNRMLKELETSAKELMLRERESAWREMAKQVAHEIKNPLTPMRLRVQHLERSWRDDPENFDQKLKVFCQTMGEQIETLTNIASEFSHFAKLPKARMEPIDLAELVEDVVRFYVSGAGIEIICRRYLIRNPLVYADRDHLIRIMNNLLTNAVQAIPAEHPGQISVQIRQCRNELIVRVKDTGAGISKDTLPLVFVPNFTTKTAGTGIGLSMVKSMVENSHGSVWVRSREGKGSSFYFSLPVFNEESPPASQEGKQDRPAG